MPDRLAKRLLIIGWDAADWKIIDALFGMGRMPALRRLVESGVRGDLNSLAPMLSPLLWTSVATGKTADKHGVLNFIEPDDTGAGLRPSSSTSRRCKALWNILTQAGLRTDVVSWYASHPAEPIRGAVVSNMFQEGMPARAADPWPMPPGAAHPAAAATAIGELRIHPEELGGEEFLSLIPDLAKVDRDDRRMNLLARQVAQCASVHNVATALLRDPSLGGSDRPADCLMVFHEVIDVVGHHFMQYFPPRMAHVSERDFGLYRHVMFGVYQMLDMMLGTMLEQAGKDATVILLSDHGFHSDHLRPPVPPSLDDAHAAMDASWHRPVGVLAMSGPGVRRASGGEDAVHGATLLDIAPTALALLGQPIGADMDGRPLLEAFDRPVTPGKVFSWDALPGEAGMHPAGARTDPFDAQQTMKQLADLGYIADVPDNVQSAMDQLRDESAFNLGVVHLSARRYDRALEQFAALAERKPAEPRYVMNVAHCQQQLGRWAEAGATLRALIAARPDLPDAKLHLSSALLADGKPEDALRTLEEAKGQLGDHPERLVLMGAIYMFTNRFEDAEATFGRLLSLDPHEARAHHGLAVTALRRRDFDASIEHALTAVELKHFFPEAYYTLGQALTWSNDHQRAVQAFGVCVSMQPGHVDAHRYLASLHRHLGDRASARKHRLLAEDLLARRDQHAPFQQGYLREAPDGPLAWAKSAGVQEDED